MYDRSYTNVTSTRPFYLHPPIRSNRIPCRLHPIHDSQQRDLLRRARILPTKQVTPKTRPQPLHLAKLCALLTRNSRFDHYDGILTLQASHNWRSSTKAELEELCYYLYNEHSLSDNNDNNT